MNKKFSILLAVAALLYVIYHFATLIYSPLPWFDEITFASITESYLKNHTYFEDARILAIPHQKMEYGPVYFMLQSFVIKTFGFGMFNFRMTNMLFGFIDLFLIYKICKKFGFNSWAAIITLLLVAIEPNFNQFLHSGRMDFVCLFFFMSAYLVFAEITSDGNVKLVLYALLTGLLLGCALLTTPRIIFAFSAFSCYFVYEMITGNANERKKALLKYLTIGVAFGAIYYLWIYTAFGNIHAYIYNNFQNSKTMKDHIGLGSNIKIRYNLFILLYAIAAFALIVRSKLFTKNAALVIFCLPAIVAFILIVTGGVSGRYFALVTPFTSLLIVGVTIQLINNKPLKYLTYTICFLFGCIFIFKSVYILSTIRQHDPKANEQIISQYLTKNTSVCGNFEYYYIARDNGCSFLSIEENGSVKEITDYLLANKIRYVLLSKNNGGRLVYEDAFLNENYKLVTIVEDRNYSNAFSRLIKKLPYMITDSYACYIYEYTGR